MEEDKIKLFLKDYEGLKKYKDFIKDIDTNFFFEFADYMIARNKELLHKVNVLETENENICHEVNVNYISKSKIEEKIEELQKEYKKISKENFLNKSETQKVLNAQIVAYKELLEN